MTQLFPYLSMYTLRSKCFKHFPEINRNNIFISGVSCRVVFLTHITVRMRITA